MTTQRELTQLYFDQGKSLAEISEILGLDYLQVLGLMKRKGLSRRAPRKPDLTNPDWLHRMYWEKELSLTAIAELFDVTPKTVMTHMEKHHIPRRARSCASKNARTAVLDEALVRWIRQLHTDGVKQSKIRKLLAERKGIEVAKGTISLIVLGKTWRHVEA